MSAGIADAIPGLSSGQRDAARVIERVLGGHGVPGPIIAAAIVNAHAESSLNPGAVGDSGHSVGLFQLHDKGAGKGMSVAARKDPAQNTERIYSVYAGSYGKPLRDAYASGERSISRLSALWSTHIERPWDTKAAEFYRSALALRLFPATVTKQLVREGFKPAVMLRRYLLFTAAGGFAIVAAVAWRERRKAQAWLSARATRKTTEATALPSATLPTR